MKRVFLFTLCLLTLGTIGPVLAGEIKPSDMSGKPTEYCTLMKAPNPALLGHYSCVHRKHNEKVDEYVMEPIEYWLVKQGDKYAIFFYRIKDGKGKKYTGWRNWYIEGDRIHNGQFLKIFVKDGDVYYQWKFNQPTKMTRIE